MTRERSHTAQVTLLVLYLITLMVDEYMQLMLAQTTVRLLFLVGQTLKS